MDATNLADLYELPLLDWSEIEADLNEGIPQVPESGGPNRHTCWLTTINADGSPHVTGIGASWVDGSFWFQTGELTRKGRNLARDPRCVLSVTTHDFDVVVEGIANKITEYGPQKVGLPGWMRAARRSLLITVLCRPVHHRGLCIVSVHR